MSDLLNDAIVDAKALREAALKNAETIVMDKYSDEVRETLEQLLEQEPPLAADPTGAADPLGGDLGADPMAGALPGDEGEEQEEIAEDIPLAATDNLSEKEGDNLTGLPRTGEEVDVEVNLDALAEAVKELQDEQEYELNEEDLTDLIEDEEPVDEDMSAAYASVEDPESKDVAGEEALAKSADLQQMDAITEDDEEVELSEELIDDIVERLTVDMGATLSGWAGRSSESMKWEMEKELAHRRSTDYEEEIETLKKAQEELFFENKQLKESLKNYKQATQELKEGMSDVNLSNARLLYTNRVLRNTSLNERQKIKIADAISKAGSVIEAKTIYQTLENATPAATKRGPQSLSEAIGRRSTSVIRASRQESTPSDPHMDRMKRLAGIE